MLFDIDNPKSAYTTFIGKDICIETTLKSNKKIVLKDKCYSEYSIGSNSEYDCSSLYWSLYIGAIKNIRKINKHDVRGQRLNIKIELDENLEGKAVAEYKRALFWKSLFTLKKQTKKFKLEVDLEKNIRNYSDSIIKLITLSKIEGLQNKLIDKTGEAIENIKEPVKELRYLAAVAKYYNYVNKKTNTSLPKILDKEDKRTIMLRMLNPNLINKVNDKDLVSNFVKTDLQSRIQVISGPNANGKSTYISGIAINQTIAQAGWPVFATYGIISPKDKILTHYVRDGDIRLNESRFQRELTRIEAIFREVTPYSLVLIDELGTGTRPDDGKEVLKDVIKVLGKSGTTSFLITHFGNGVLEMIEKTPYAKNIHCVSYEKEGDLVFTYKIEDGSSDKSEGLYLARKRGINEEGLVKILQERENRGEIKLLEN